MVREVASGKLSRCLSGQSRRRRLLEPSSRTRTLESMRLTGEIPMTQERSATAQHGFASMDVDKQREIARKGGASPQ
jgi:Stress-induced bacterial acidophilic repeat motif